MSIIVSIIVSFLTGLIIYLIGFYFGIKKGKIDGVTEFMSILKVYDFDLTLKIGDTLNRISLLSEDEKKAAFYNYLEKYKNVS